MGRNAAIRHYESHPEGQPMELFDERSGKLPVVLEILKSPWVIRGSEMPARDDPMTVKRFATPISVAWDAQAQAPAAFILHGRGYHIETVVQTWSVERRWWDPSGHVSRLAYRVISQGGIYDIAYDRLRAEWLLIGISD